MGKGNYLNFGESPFSGAMVFVSKQTTFANSTSWTPKKMMGSEEETIRLQLLGFLLVSSRSFSVARKGSVWCLSWLVWEGKNVLLDKKRCSWKSVALKKKQHGSLGKNIVLLRCVSICQLNISTWKHKELQETKKTTSSSNLGWKFCSLPLFT